MKFFTALTADKIIDMVPDFYAMPKLHKNPISTRPICPSVGWLTSRVSKFVDRQIKMFLTEFPWNLSDTPSFIRKMEKLRIPEGSFLISFDVESMYTKIGNNEAIARLTLLLKSRMSSDRYKSIIEMIKWVLDNNYVRFQGETFQQCKGVAMGTPMAPTYASLFM